MFSVRRMSWKDTSMVNICDRELIGKTLTDGNVKMHLSEEYFSGDILGEDEVVHLIQGSSIISLAGQGAVGLAVEHRMASKEAVKLVDGVPFLMIYKFFY
jgi:hypothetical protein